MIYDKTWCVSEECKNFRECEDALTDEVKNKLDGREVSMSYEKCGDYVKGEW